MRSTRPNPYDQFRTLCASIPSIEEPVDPKSYLERVPRCPEYFREKPDDSLFYVSRWYSFCSGLINNASPGLIDILTLDSPQDIVEKDIVRILNRDNRSVSEALYVLMRSAGVGVDRSIEVVSSSTEVESVEEFDEPFFELGFESNSQIKKLNRRLTGKLAVVRCVQWLNADSHPQGVMESIRAGVVEQIRAEAS